MVSGLNKILQLTTEAKKNSKKSRLERSQVSVKCASIFHQYSMNVPSIFYQYSINVLSIFHHFPSIFHQFQGYESWTFGCESFLPMFFKNSARVWRFVAMSVQLVQGPQPVKLRSDCFLDTDSWIHKLLGKLRFFDALKRLGDSRFDGFLFEHFWGNWHEMFLSAPCMLMNDTRKMTGLVDMFF